MFFVISGYLITGLILADLRDGTFSLRSFWERRARRLLPALFVVVSFASRSPSHCFFSTIYKYLPGASLQRHSICRTSSSGNMATISASRCISSAAAYMVARGGGAVLHPFPALPSAVWRWVSDRLLVWLLIVVLGSSCRSSPRLPPLCRLLSLAAPRLGAGAGSLLALRAARTAKPPGPGEPCLLGLGLIGWSVLTYSAATMFPGPGALLPVSGLPSSFTPAGKARARYTGRSPGGRSSGSASCPTRSISALAPHRVRGYWRVEPLSGLRPLPSSRSPWCLPA